MKKNITIFTDFDNTMVKLHTFHVFLGKMIRKRPFRILYETVDGLVKHGLSSKAAIDSVIEVDQKERKLVAEKVIEKAEYNPKWVRRLHQCIEKHNPEEIELVIITRNFSIFPEIFMKKYGHQLYKISFGRYKGNYTIIGNENLQQTSITNSLRRPIRLHHIINHSHDKERYINKKGAVYFGDAVEFRELSRCKNLKNLEFYRV